MYYVIKILGFLTPLPFMITFSNKHNQKLPFSDPLPLLPFCNYVRNTWMFPWVGSLQAKSKRNLLENLNGFGAQFIESKIDGLEGFER